MRHANFPIKFIWGPTSTGKTGASISRAQATGWPVISTDRIQCCAALSTGSGRPTNEELRGTRRIYLCDQPLSKGMISAEQAHAYLKTIVTEYQRTNNGLILEGGSVSLFNQIVQDPFWSQGFVWHLIYYRLGDRNQFLKRARMRISQMFSPPPGYQSIIDELLAGWKTRHHREILADVVGYRAIITFAHRELQKISALTSLRDDLKVKLIDEMAQEYLTYATWQERSFLPISPAWYCEQDSEGAAA